jgi:lysophospholipase L1-like esterase
MPSDDLRLCFVGDSFVNGTNDPNYLGWTGRLSMLARGRGHMLTCYNLGVRRDTSSEIAARWESEAQRRLPNSCTPYVVFSYGVNDTMIEGGISAVAEDVSVANTRRMLQTANKLGYRVVLIGPPPITDSQQNGRTRRLSAAMARAAESVGVPFLAVFDDLIADPAWMAEMATGDGAHPGALGYARFAALVDSWDRWWFKK